MKFVVENEALAKGLGAVKGGLRKSNVQIFQHIVIVAEIDAGGPYGRIEVRANNQYMELAASILAEVEVPGATTVPGEMIAALAQGLAKGGQAEFELVDNQLKVRSGKSKFDLQTLPIEDFPTRAEMSGETCAFSMPAAALRDILEKTMYPTGPKHPKLYCQGVYLHPVGSKLRAVSTDHLRLAVKDTKLPDGAGDMPGVVIPTETVQEIVDLLEDEGAAEVAVNKGMIEVKQDGARLVSSLINCEFPPDYERVIPKTNGKFVEISAETLSEAVRRSAVVFLGIVDIKNKVQTVVLDARDGAVIVKAQAKGQSEEVIEADTGATIAFVANVTHIQQMLATWPDGAVVRYHTAGAGKAILFECKEYPDERHVIMPCLF